MNEETRVIFLDVDGVLNSRPQLNVDYEKRTDSKDIGYHLYDPYIRNLSRIYHKYSDTKIVLTSTWRIDVEANNIMGKLLTDKLAEYDIEIFDTVPDRFDNGEPIGSRPEEIVEWLNLHPEINYWVSIEDDCNEEMYKKADPYCHTHLCKTEWGTNEDTIEDCGLNLIKTHVALEILGGKYD